MLLKILLSILSGIIIFLSFPKFNFPFLAWVGFVPLLIAVQNTRLKFSILLTLVTGLTANGCIYYWVIITCLADGRSIIFGVFVWLLLVIYLSLYFGIFGAILRLLNTYISKGGNTFLFIFGIVTSWVTLEFMRAHLFSGFPWMLLGHSQWKNLYTIQSVDIWGVYGISFVIILINTLLFILLKNISCWKYGLIGLVLVLVNLLYGINKYEEFESKQSNAEKEIKIALLQGSIDQYKKWDQKYENEILNTYWELARTAVNQGSYIMVWPETAMPYLLNIDNGINKWLNDLIKPTASFHIIGSMAKEKNGYLNSAFLYNQQGELISQYDKVHLLPFSETIPFESYLTEVAPVLKEFGGFISGKSYEPLKVNNYNLGVTICYESIFPEIARELAKQNVDMFINITNDAWFLNTSAPYQHFAMNIFRAVENRINLARSANTGISAFISPSGRIEKSSKIFEKVSLNHTVKIVQKKRTFYTMHGDIFALISMLVSVIIIMLLFRLQYVNFKKIK
ncbi:MAG: apolipoprotein N-acyltransferase [bacterium]